MISHLLISTFCVIYFRENYESVIGAVEILFYDIFAVGVFVVIYFTLFELKQVSG